ncbi:inositol monophosphatase family protein [Aestuariimicrobium ganziense]|uniref:inositol monophosphatase family protein n=1 Tax=Aestuariimicrobium ganziense TaxID=2773677 RepID=UPI0019445C51|nr:inositol monophosphatase [Aestuariimicrobium ganziense]
MAVTTQGVLDLLVRVSAEVVEPRFGRLASHDVDEKQPGDLVTVADREAEQVLTAELLRMTPGALVVGEEASFDQPALVTELARAEHAFTVDPVDGTRNFTNGSPDHAMMLTELVRGEVVRAWIWQPQHQHSFVVERGAGVLLDGEPLGPATRPQVPRGASSRRHLLGQDFGGRIEPIGKSRWCCGVDYPWLATGGVDFLCYWNLKPWDHLPGALMLRELGGEVLMLEGGRYGASSSGQGLIAAATPELAEFVRASWAADRG